jgi:glycosyltransferase involved in cell wall biosynthesis
MDLTCSNKSRINQSLIIIKAVDVAEKAINLMKQHQSCIHLWIPNMFEFKGGIQVYSAFLLDALHNLNLDVNYEVFLKHDTKRTGDLNGYPNTKFHFAGSAPSKIKTAVFASQILTRGIIRRPELVIATHINFAPAAYRLKQLTGIPYWAVAHGVDAWNIQKTSIQKSLHHADLILPVGGYTRYRLIAEQRLDPAKLAVLPNTFDLDRWKIAPKPQYLLDRYHLTDRQQIILTVARLDSTEQYKGYDQILQALPEIRTQIPDVHYLLVGKGSDRPRIEQTISDLHLQDCVTLAGFISDEELCDHYNLCDVFAMPSKGEGFGIVYLEALACGKPTLGGDQDGAIDALCHGELGVLVNPDDVDLIAQTLTQILQKTYAHPILYQPEILQERVIDKFGFSQFTQTLQKLLIDQGFI